MRPHFKLGQICMTAGVADHCVEDACFADLVKRSLAMHASGNWGDVSDEDWESNQHALHTGQDRLFSVYYLGDATAESIWIITEWDHSVTTILFPEEY